jgi:superfamily II DNA/RNA helicase
MLDMGFLPDIKRIIALLPSARQTLLFSATYSDEIRALANQWLRDPAQVEVSPRNSVTDTVTHTVFKVDSRFRREALVNLLRARDMRQVLIFCNTKIGANRLAYKLQKDGLDAAAIHSDRTQLERMQALAEFKEGKIAILVATDIAARGLDIDQLPFVVNFDLPSNPEDYVHRIGRTGRAGLEGEAISLIGAEDHEKLASVERLIRKKLPLVDLPAARHNVNENPARSEHARPRRNGSTRPASKTQITTDPLFDRSYEALQHSAPKAVEVASALVASRQHKKKQIAALLLPPATKQDA